MTVLTAPTTESERLSDSGMVKAAGSGATKRHAAGYRDSQAKAQFLARMTGFLFLVTYAASIPAFFWFYAPALNDPAFILGEGLDGRVSLGALLELMVIFANVGTALTLYPILKARFEVLSLGYVAARLVESGFIAVGIIAMMALNTMRLHVDGADNGVLVLVGQTLVAIHDWTFRIGPGVVVGVGNGLILGYMLWRTRLVPRAMSILGLIGGPSLLVAGFAVLFGWIEAGSTAQAIATVPEFFWELFLGVWLLVKGFSTTALSELDN